MEILFHAYIRHHGEARRHRIWLADFPPHDAEAIAHWKQVAHDETKSHTKKGQHSRASDPQENLRKSQGSQTLRQHTKSTTLYQA